MTRELFLALAAVGCTGGREPAAQDVATIRVFEEGIGASGRVAVFQGPDGAVRAAVPTADDGSATAPVQAGDMVTLANVGASRFELTTYVDLRPGDLAVVGELATEGDESASTGLVQVALPAAPPGATGLEVSAGRSFVPHLGAPLGVQLVDAGADAGTVVGIATDAAGAPVAYTRLDTRAGVPGAPATLPAWRTDWERIDLRVANLPASATTTARVDALAGDARFPALAAGPTARLIPPGLARAIDVAVSVTDGDTRRDWRRTGPLVHELALAASDLLPAITTVELTAAADRPAVAWTVAAAPGAADAVVIQLAWGDGDAHRWTVIAPATLRQFRFPALPDQLAGWRPGADLRVGVALIDSTAFADTHELMRHGLDALAEADAELTLRTSSAGHVELP